MDANNTTTANKITAYDVRSSKSYITLTFNSTNAWNLTEAENYSTATPKQSNEIVVDLGTAAETIIYLAYIIAIILSVSGNLISIIVFARGRRCNTDIRAFLINLAVADLLMASICLPFSFTSALLREWKFPAAMCPLILFTQVLSVTVSVYTNTAISIDRFLAIKYPFKLLRTSSRKYSRWAIAVIWIVSIGLSAIQLVMGKVRNDVCQEVWPKVNGIDFRRWYTLIILIITYIIPVVFIMTMYGLVCIQLWFRATPGVGDHIRDARQLTTKRKVVKMLMWMIALFTLCWMPLHTFFLLLDFSDVFMSYSLTELSYIYFAVHWLAMSNSFQNPIIYGFVNDNFRSDLAEMLLKCCPPLSSIKALQKAALANQPLSRLSTKMTIMMDKADSRSDMYRNGRKTNFSRDCIPSVQSTSLDIKTEEDPDVDVPLINKLKSDGKETLQHSAEHGSLLQRESNSPNETSRDLNSNNFNKN